MTDEQQSAQVDQARFDAYVNEIRQKMAEAAKSLSTVVRLDVASLDYVLGCLAGGNAHLQQQLVLLTNETRTVQGETRRTIRVLQKALSGMSNPTLLIGMVSELQNTRFRVNRLGKKLGLARDRAKKRLELLRVIQNLTGGNAPAEDVVASVSLLVRNYFDPRRESPRSPKEEPAIAPSDPPTAGEPANH